MSNGTSEMVEVEAWVLRYGKVKNEAGRLEKKIIKVPSLGSGEVLAEPIYGCWEGNMTHALRRDPVDICIQRGEEEIVLGNAGVVRIEAVGADVTHLKPGDLCGLISVKQWDEYGYPKTILAYDAVGTMGMLAKKAKFDASQLFLLDTRDDYALRQWAAFPIRYVTAWDNWKVAYGAWALQMDREKLPRPYVWGWGGGVALGELALAKHFGCDAVLITSGESRKKLCESMGIKSVERKNFPDLQFDETRFKEDFEFRRKYAKSERIFLDIVDRLTEGQGVSIFIDNIGAPVHRATIKALGRQGVITTSGWKEGGHLYANRASECINRHIHVHTHGSKRSDEAVIFARENAWLPPVDNKVYDWDELPQLADDFEQGKIESYFPIFSINKL